jgi:hypothetical protein
MTKSTKLTLEVNQLYKEIKKSLKIKNRIEKKTFNQLQFTMNIESVKLSIKNF